MPPAYPDATANIQARLRDVGWLYLPDVIPNADAYLSAIRDTVPWTEQMRARQTASMGIPYNYAGASYPDNPWLLQVREIGQIAVSAQVDVDAVHRRQPVHG